jgi:hypothetical protein
MAGGWLPWSTIGENMSSVSLSGPQGSSAESPLREQFRKGYNLISWVHSGMAFWVVSDVNSNDLGEFLSLVLLADP